MESKLLATLTRLEANKTEIKAYVPGHGFRLCNVTKVNGDIITIQLSSNKNSYSLHYSAMVIERAAI